MPPKALRGGGALSSSGEPEPQAVQVKLPTGDVELRLAAIDTSAGQLSLRQLNLDENGSVAMGAQAVISLSSLGKVSVEDKVVLLRGAGTDKVLLELNFSSAALARTWGSVLERSSTAAAAPKGAKGKADSTAADPDSSIDSGGEGTTGMLRQLIEQQEEQVRLLEVINGQKEQQLLQMQQQLEDSLTKLQECQVTYSQQQRHLEQQQNVIDGLRMQSQAASVAEAACSANGRAAAQGAAAAKAQRLAPVPQADEEDEEDDYEDEDADDEEERELRAKLAQLEAEKMMLEGALGQERGGMAGMASQLRDLQGLMAALGVSGAETTED